MTQPNPNRQKTPRWEKSDPLYRALVDYLPTFVDNPFTAEPTLNVPKLCVAIGKSHEGVYKWLSAGKIIPANALLIVDLAKSDDNLAALKQLGREAPKIEDFVPLFYK
jgi:hypothetical protein